MSVRINGKLILAGDHRPGAIPQPATGTSAVDFSILPQLTDWERDQCTEGTASPVIKLRQERIIALVKEQAFARMQGTFKPGEELKKRRGSAR